MCGDVLSCCSCKVINCADPCAWAASAACVACLAYLSYPGLYWPDWAYLGKALQCCDRLSLVCLVECSLISSLAFDCSLLGMEMIEACDCYVAIEASAVILVVC